MDFFEFIVLLAFLIMTANVIKPFIASLTRKRAAIFAILWLALYIAVWGIPSFGSTPDEVSGGGNEAISENQQNQDEAPIEEKEELAKIEEEIDFDPASIEVIVNAQEVLGLSREEFLSNFPKEINPDKKDPMKMVFENGEVTFQNNIAISMTYYPEALQYPGDNRLLLASLGYEVQELRKGSNPFETPVTIYLIDGFSDVTIYGEKEVEENPKIEKIYIKKEYYKPTIQSDDEEAED
ncbi:hypothetical protein [Guptibacillus hwajinpoensis]|uniref:Uncharacterized protein n=1 Tax=Guptibacillus hwajinpoensis TaxID=208199 RepID=A0A0J6CVL0_9BACL|nr:hypothetical protein [Alkalihalobacillus macyae]KMM37193.1 hypothetical protein AB986_15085 [Alkalihalobacillus macyae]